MHVEEVDVSGDGWFDREDLAGAVEWMEKALEMAQDNGQGMHAALCLEGLAELSVARGEVGPAGRYAEELLAMAEKNGLWEMVALAHRWRGAALSAEGQFEDAEEALLQAAELAKEIGRVRLEWNIQEALHQLYKTRSRDELAREHRDIVQSIVRQIGENLQQAEMRAGLPG